ncbi:MAG: DNA alkylation repair protein [Patescibacteria group bacterium]
MSDIGRALRKYASKERATINQRFFKTGKGQYGEDDRFLGVTVPNIRVVAKQFRDASMSEMKDLLTSEWHEDRLLALIIWTLQFSKANERGKREIFKAYLSSTAQINNWDLVDVSAPNIVGEYLVDRDRKVLLRLARSKSLWERRVAIVSTFAFIRRGDATSTFTIADLVMSDQQDLMHKATGWMLREVGKKCGKAVLVSYLLPRYKRMPRTMLRYAIEHFPLVERKRWLLGTMC